MRKLFSQREFVPDNTYIQVLQVVSDEPDCTISTIVARLLPEQGEYSVRSRVRQLVLRRYLFEGLTRSEILLTITGKGRAVLQESPP